MKRSRLHTVLSCYLAAAVATSGCHGPRVMTPAPAKPAPTTTPAVAAPAVDTRRPEIPIEIEPGGKLTARTLDRRVAQSAVEIANLSDDETRALHARMEPLPVIDNSTAPVVRPPSAMPQVATTSSIGFVVPTGKPVTDAPIAPGKLMSPLATPQITPDREVRAESEIRVRFSEPMVPVSAVDTVATPNIEIKPAVAGTWRWIDTRVVQFTATPRLPQATVYTVTVPAGIEAVSGARLGSAATQTFSTPPVQLSGTYPNNQIRPDAPIAVRFDQDVDVASVLGKLRIGTRSIRSIPYKVIDLPTAKALWARDPSKPWNAKTDLAPDRHVILAPQTAWPSGSELAITLDKGAPSKEGPRLAAEPSRVRVDVVPAFAVRGIECAEQPDDPSRDYSPVRPKLAGARCPANGYLTVRFASPIAQASYRSSKVQIVGEPFKDHDLAGDAVTVEVPSVVGRGYRIALDDGLVDIHGQAMVGPRSLSFVTGPEQFFPRLEAPTGVHVLDPRFETPQWVVAAEAVGSLRVQLYRVSPSDYPAYVAFEQDRRLPPPGKKFHDETHAVGGKQWARLNADLRPGLTDGFGHVVAIATVTGARTNVRIDRRVAWIQVTHLGASARIDGDKINAWVRDLDPQAFLAPRGDVEVALAVEGRPEVRAATAADGHVALDLPPAMPRKPGQELPIAMLRMARGADSAFAVIGRYEQTQRVHDALWYVTDDRFTYKPGESVYVKGWVRWTHNGPNPDLAMPNPGEQVSYTLTDARGTKIASGQVALTERGGFDVEVALPKNINLGQAAFTFVTRGDTTRHPISVQEFRTPAYAVTLDDDVTHHGGTPLILGESIEMTAAARYYAGGGLGGAAIAWEATLTATRFQPPGWSRFEFDPPRSRARRSWYYDRYDDTAVSASQLGSLSGASSASVTWGMAALPHGRPSILAVDATVTDVDRMSIRASSRPILVHPAAYYVGLRLDPHDSQNLQAVVTDIDGTAVAGVPIDLEIVSVLESERYRDDAKAVERQGCKLTSGTAPLDCRFQRKLDYAMFATARIADPRGRANVTELVIPWYSRDDKQPLAIVPDKTLYRPGDVARLEIKSRTVPARAIVTFARQGVFDQKLIELAQPSTFVELPIAIGMIRNVHVHVDRLAKRERQQGNDPRPLPEQVSAEVDLAVDLESARLDVRAKPTAKLVQPGDDATFEIDVRHDDKPVANAEVALIVVDEAILALSGRTHADPLLPFYRTVGGGTWAWNTLGMVHDSGLSLKDKPGFERGTIAGGSSWGAIGTGSYGTVGHGAGGGGMGMGSSIVTARKDFRPTAVFSPKLVTDANGHASVTVKMPDSLTRYRVVALASADVHRFGKGEDTIVAQRKVNARTIAPRFLTQGDRFSLPVLVQNLDSRPRTIAVAVRAANLIAEGPQGKRVTIPAGQRAEVRFGFATERRGKAVIQTIMTSGGYADASNVELPVYEPATTEAFATYGVVEAQPQREQLVIPANVFPEVGGLEVEIASTQLQALTDAYWYLEAYPYECAEQRSSRMLATTAMYDILDAFATPGRPTKTDLDAQQAYDFAQLAKTQRPDGGWGYFADLGSDPMVSMQVLAALASSRRSADAKTIENGAMVQRAIGFATKQLAAAIAKLSRRAAIPALDRRASGDDAYLIGLAAHALSELAVAGQDMRPRAIQLHALATALKVYPVDAKARVLAVLAKQASARQIRSTLVGELVSAIHETAAAATVATSYVEDERLMLPSSTKTNALVLDAMLREVPEHALIEKLARGVLAGRKHGRWMTTQENLVALQAMRRYFDVFEKDTPSYTGKLWLGTAGYAEQSFVGRSSARGVARAGWATLAPGTTHDLVFAREPAGNAPAAGRLYYRVGIVYAPKQVELPALDAGFVVRRRYTAVDDPADVVANPDGSYKIKLGAKVLVTIETTNTTTRHAVAVVDPLPAGFEAVNTALATAERAVVTQSDHWDHQNLRDNRAEAFDMEQPAGVHRYAYTVRATTPGSFVAAPAKAEEMYAPETFGRSNGMRVTIE